MSARRTLSTAIEAVTLKEPFRISGYVFTDMPVVVVRLTEGAATGEGEASGVYYLQDDPPKMQASIEAVREEIEAGCDREALRELLPPGGARNAVDAALWDLEARLTGRPAYELAGLPSPTPLTTTFTIGADDPGIMADKARGWSAARALKLKLTGEAALDGERVAAVRRARPDVWIGVDANQGFDPDSLGQIMPTLVDCQVRLVEQPFARGREADLDGYASPIPLAADESVQGFDELEALVGRFEIVNIKLDKCGGLTEGLAMARAAPKLGLGLMVGNMVGTSLSMGPAYLLGQLCQVVDLDGPCFISKDRADAVRYEDGRVSYPAHAWGDPT